MCRYVQAKGKSGLTDVGKLCAREARLICVRLKMLNNRLLAMAAHHSSHYLPALVCLLRMPKLGPDSGVMHLGSMSESRQVCKGQAVSEFCLLCAACGMGLRRKPGISVWG